MAIGCTIEELGDRMSDEEFAFWQARWELLPWGDEADWIRHADRHAFEANRYRKKNAPPVKVEDFYIPHNLD